MKQKAMRDVSAFTFIEMLVVIVIIAVVAALLLPHFSRATAKSPRIACVNNLKQIGTAYRVWEGDGDRFPAQQTVFLGGWRDYLTNADQGAICWTNYVIMSNELGLNPKLLVCPTDERVAATNFATDFKDNTHLSYFVGVSANDTYPQSILGGDRNLGNELEASGEYGYSPKNGKGNDVAIPIFGPVSWSVKMHSLGCAACEGNILLGDTSAQQVSGGRFLRNWLSHADPTTEWPAGHIPADPSIRVVFP
jgi:prepilin-type N-terminal cleavage/methylation domain-containing protein